MLRTLTDKDKQSSREHLQKAIHAYNCTKHESTGYYPVYLMYGYHPWLPVDLLFGLVQEDGFTTPHGYAEHWAHRMAQVYRIAAQSSKQMSLRNKENYGTYEYYEYLLAESQLCHPKTWRSCPGKEFESERWPRKAAFLLGAYHLRCKGAIRW